MTALPIEPYVVAACEMPARSIFTAGMPRQDLLDANIARCMALAERAAGDHGARLIVFPQFGLTGHAMVSPEAWHAAAITFPGPELDRIGAVARRTGTWIVVQAPERHAAFPGRHFLSCAILGPDGGPVLVHRKSYTLSLRTSPIDVHDRFIRTFGDDAFFPVADTPIGRLAATIGAELHWPEVGRALALKGAEIIVNPIAADPHLDYLQRAGADHVRAVRSFENMVYLVTANVCGDAPAPPSTIHDFKGADIGNPDHAPFTLAQIDVAALRTWRAQPGANLLAQIQGHTLVHPAPETHWPVGDAQAAAPNTFDALLERETAAWKRLQSRWPGGTRT